MKTLASAPRAPRGILDRKSSASLPDVRPAPALETPEADWVPFPGGELEGRRPRVLCPACRALLQRAVDEGRKSGLLERGRSAGTAAKGAAGRPLCFACYRAELARDRAIQAAGNLDTASEARFQSQLPLEPVNHSRLVRLRAERAVDRTAAREGTGHYVDRRRQAQIAARHALQQIAAGVRRHQAQQATAATSGHQSASAVRQESPFSTAETRLVHAGEVWASIHAAELQLPETWLPFVTAR